MTTIFFVRHAEPNHKWKDDRTKPLSDVGIQERLEIIEILENKNISMIFSSPYKRSFDTIEPLAHKLGIEILTDEGFIERKVGKNGNNMEMFKKRWSDLTYCEEGGESIKEVQNRNIKGLENVLNIGKNKNIIIGTHGTALSSILRYYNSNYGVNDFLRIINYMPYIVRLEFENNILIGMKEEFFIEKKYKIL